MGVIQGAINQTLGTAAAAAYLGKSLSEGVGAKIAEEKIPEIKEETEELKSQAADIEEKKFEATQGNEDALLEEKGVDTTDEKARKEALAGLSEEESEQVYGRTKALKAQLDAVQGRIQQKQDIQGRLEEVASGKLKKTKREVEKIIGGKK